MDLSYFVDSVDFDPSSSSLYSSCLTLVELAALSAFACSLAASLAVAASSAVVASSVVVEAS